MKFPSVYGNGGNGTSGCPKCKKKVGNFCIDDPNKFADPANNCCGTGKIWDDVNQICVDDTSTNNAAVVDAAVVVQAIEDATAKSAQAGYADNSNVGAVTKILEKYVPTTVVDNIATNMKFNLSEAAATGWGGAASNNIATKMFEQFGAHISSDTSNELSNMLRMLEDAWTDYHMPATWSAAANTSDWDPSAFSGALITAGGDWRAFRLAPAADYATSYGTVQLLMNFGEDLPASIANGPQAWEWWPWDYTDGTSSLVAEMQIYDAERLSNSRPLRSNLLISSISATGDYSFTEHDGFNEYMDPNPVKIYGLYSWEGTSVGFVSKAPVFSYKNSDGQGPSWTGAGWSGDTYEMDSRWALGYLDSEQAFLKDRYGYPAFAFVDLSDPDNQENAKASLIAQIQDHVETLTLSVVVDEVTSQIINNVIDYGDLKQSHLTSISVSEATQETTEAISSRIEY